MINTNLFRSGLVSLFVLLLSVQIVFARDEDSLRVEILQAVIDGANYASDVLLDEQGKSPRQCIDRLIFLRFS